MILLQILSSTLAVALLSTIGIVLLFLSKKNLSRILLSLVALSAGAMFGNAVFHLLPEAIESAIETGSGPLRVLAIFSGAFVVSFLFEQLSRSHHCHSASHHGEESPTFHCHVDVKPFSHLIIISDAVHNFIDGLIIAAGFLVSPVLGITTTVAVALHEIPQEIGDYASLIYGGYKKKQALILNFFAAMTVVVGGVTGYFISTFAAATVPFLLPFAAGSFVYIAASDLLPELKHKEHLRESLTHVGVFMLGLMLMFVFALNE